MSEPYVGEIRMFAGNFAPRGWALCDGQLLAVSQNDALFSLLGTIYGGDGRTTFGLPDMRGRIPIHQGQGPSLSMRRLGAKFGAETERLTINQMPSHTHSARANSFTAESVDPRGAYLGNTTETGVELYDTFKSLSSIVSLNEKTISNAGASISHTNMMPSICVNFIIALVGVYPSRT